MKKTGFTLAEVLITLAIIGVVATLTLPALMQNTQEQQARTALKKGINTLTELVSMNQAIEGFDYASIGSADTSERDATRVQSLYAMLVSRGSVDLSRTGSVKDMQPALVSFRGDGVTEPEETFVVTFRDGSMLFYNPAETVMGAKAEAVGGDISFGLDDNLARGIPAILDTNGTRGPNILSNCAGAANGVPSKDARFDDNAMAGLSNATSDDTGSEEGGDVSTDRLDACRTPGQRVIRDQFALRLRGNVAVPDGPAAQWAFEN